MQGQPGFSDEFDETFEVGGVAGNLAYFGRDVLRGLIQGIEDFAAMRQNRWRGFRTIGPALIGSAMWIDDPQLLDAIAGMAAASVIVTKQGRKATDLRKLEPLAQLNLRTPGMPIRAFRELADLAPTVDGQSALVGPYDRPDSTMIPTIRTLGWRRRSAPVPIVHAKLALLGHLWWHDEGALGEVEDIIGFRSVRLWVSSANFTRASRESLEFGYWTEEPSLLAGARRFLTGLMAASESIDAEADEFEPELGPYEFDDEAMAGAAAELAWDDE